MEKKKYYKKNNKKNYKKDVAVNNVSDKKLTYDEIVNVRHDISEIKMKNDNDVKTMRDNIPIYRFITVSLILLAIIFCSLLLFRII